MIVRRHVIYSGRVQGVGFRYTAQALARNLKVAGFVRNLPNGTVELVVEGAAEQAQMLLDRIAERMAEYVENAQATNETPEGLTGFGIRY
jgi:acylphosphatase